ncbi:MAG: 4-hydroxy-tetrahydrodipicolinate synthase [Firmicutes bacterium]|nr:4-hydroxy-tetrahydrodipicolinate synthase [Bacillota bacterium]
MKRLKGIVVPIVTPFDDSGRVDIEALQNLCEYLIENGVHGIYPCGTTGEAVLLTMEERKTVAEVVVREVNGRIPVFVHVGAASTQEAMDLARHAVEIGADGIAAVTPYYFALSQSALIRYYEQIISVIPSDFPLYLYNIPGYTGNDIAPATAAYLARKHSNIVGIKNTMADILRAQEYLECREGFSVLMGNDMLTAMGVMMGCDGTVSASAQVAPHLFVKLYDAAAAGDWELALALQKQAAEVTRLLENGTNISLCKYAIAHRGIPVGDIREPLERVCRKKAAEVMTKIDELGVC